MDDGETGRFRDLVHRAHEALAEVGRMQARCPEGVDRFDWSADLLDELARVALQVGDVAAEVTGGEDDELERTSRELATVIVRRRNDGPGRRCRSRSRRLAPRS